MAHQIWRRGVLLAEDKGTAGPEARYQASSISKVVVAVSMVSPALEGLLSLDDPVSKWCTPTPPAWANIRVEHLIAHTSGFGHWSDVSGCDLDYPPSPDQLLALVAAEPLLSEPGEVWRYSGPGYVLAAKIIENATGQSYGSVAAAQVFGRLGMDATTSGRVPAPAERAEPFQGGEPVALTEGLTALPGTGDVWTTVGDLVRLGDLRTSAEFASVWSTMSRPGPAVGDHSPGHVIATAYGYGLYLGTICGRAAVFHHGDNPGFRSMLACLPDEDTIVAILSNEDSTDVDALTGQLVLAAIARAQT